ncbi:hypothetical protein ACR9E3_02800 [Actinomycetospora sp. C-140]
MTVRDVAAGVLVALAVAAWVFGTAFLAPLDGARGTAVVMTALGLAAALVGGTWHEPVRNPTVLRAPAALGLVAMLAALTGIATGSRAALSVLVLLLVVLWMLATLHHLSGTRRPPPR